MAAPYASADLELTGANAHGTATCIREGRPGSESRRQLRRRSCVRQRRRQPPQPHRSHQRLPKLDQYTTEYGYDYANQDPINGFDLSGNGPGPTCRPPGVPRCKKILKATYPGPKNGKKSAGRTGYVEISGKVCLIVCISGGFDVEPKGHARPFGGIGLGIPGVGGGATAHYGKPKKGLGISEECSAGETRVSYSGHGDIGLGVGTYDSTPTCSISLTVVGR